MRVVLSVVEKHSDMPVKKYVCMLIQIVCLVFMLEIMKYLLFLVKLASTVLLSNRNFNSKRMANLRRDRMQSFWDSQAVHC